jgi:hypothetical protein
MPRPHLTPGKDPVPIVQEAGWGSGPVWTGAENLTSTGIRSPDRPARRQSHFIFIKAVNSGFRGEKNIVTYLMIHELIQIVMCVSCHVVSAQ